MISAALESRHSLCFTEAATTPGFKPGFKATASPATVHRYIEVTSVSDANIELTRIPSIAAWRPVLIGLESDPRPADQASTNTPTRINSPGIPWAQAASISA